MNLKDLMIFAGVALAAYLVISKRGGTAARSEIENPSLPGQIGFGWRYFTDGTAIAPDGTRYRNGVAVVQASYNGVNAGGSVYNLI